MAEHTGAAAAGRTPPLPGPSTATPLQGARTTGINRGSGRRRAAARRQRQVALAPQCAPAGAHETRLLPAGCLAMPWPRRTIRPTAVTWRGRSHGRACGRRREMLASRGGVTVAVTPASGRTEQARIRVMKQDIWTVASGSNPSHNLSHSLSSHGPTHEAGRRRTAAAREWLTVTHPGRPHAVPCPLSVADQMGGAGPATQAGETRARKGRASAGEGAGRAVSFCRRQHPPPPLFGLSAAGCAVALCGAGPFL